MRKSILIAVMTLLSLGALSAQNTSYGATAGYYNLTIKASDGDISASIDLNGFYAGFFANFKLSEQFSLQPELQFGTSSKDGESIEQILLPMMVQYKVSEKFNLQAGPQFDLVVSESDGINAFGLGLGFGAGYDISNKFFASARYAFGLSNRIEDAPDDVSQKLNTIQIGIGYRF